MKAGFQGNARIGPVSGQMGADAMIDTADAATMPPAETTAGIVRPSLWSAIWAGIALLWLMVGRRSFGRMGR